MSNCCSLGTFLHFSLSSHLNICYYHQGLHQRRFDPGSRLRLQHHRCALQHIGPASSARRQGVGATLERHPFSGLVDSAGYTLLSEFRLLWPPFCCLDQPTPFVGSDEHRLWHLNPAFGSSCITSSAYHKWPTRNPVRA